MSGSRLCTLCQLNPKKLMMYMCQCPMSGSRLCTPKFQRSYSDCFWVSMPYVGLTSLHDTKEVMRERNLYPCQCPMSGSRLCTEYRLKAVGFHYNAVSMPYVGLTSLHSLKSFTELLKGMGVNALCRAHVSAQYYRDMGMMLKENVSMPYVGLTSLHQDEKNCNFSSTDVSMPYVGLTSLHRILISSMKVTTWCQCPMSGSRLCTHIHSDSE